MELTLDICCLRAWGPVQGGEGGETIGETSQSKIQAISHKSSPAAHHHPFVFLGDLPSALWLELWLVLVQCVVRSRGFVRWQPRRQPCSAAVSAWERWGAGASASF